MDAPLQAQELQYPVSPYFAKALTVHWGSNPKAIAKEALNEAFRISDIKDTPLDYDDQVDLALEIGQLVGSSHEAGVDSAEFTRRFVNELMVKQFAE